MDEWRSSSKTSADSARDSREVFRSYASHRLVQVRTDVNLVLSDQLQRVFLDLVGLHQDLYNDRPIPNAGPRGPCRHVEARRVCLDDDLESLQSRSPRPEAIPSDLFVDSPGPNSGGLIGGYRRRGDTEVSFSASELDAESRISMSVEQMSGISSPLANDFQPFDLHDLWRQDDDYSRSRSTTKPEAPKKAMKMLRRGSLEFRSGAEVTGRGGWSFLVMRPSSPQCLFWDVCCFIAIIHDTLMIPLLSAFPINGQDPILHRLELVSSCIWFADVPLTFFRGFLDTRKGIVELRLQQIAIHYARGWMLSDVCLCVIDVVSYMMGDVELASLTLLRLIRNLRIFRILKMASRLAVLKEMMMSIDSRLDSGNTGTTGSIFVETSLVVVKQLGVIALLCHFTGCTWYAIGAQMMNGATWVTAHSELREATLGEDCPWEYMYITAVHWSLTQFTPAAMDVVAVTSIERVFSVVVTLAGLIVFSFFIGTINQALAKLRYATAQELQQNQLVRRYVNENGISVGLATEILTFIKRRGVGKAQSKLVSGDIKILKVLPRALRDNLLEEVSMPVLTSHPLLHYLSLMGYPEMARLCHKAIKESSVVHGEEIFHPNSAPDRFIFLMNGRLKYSSDAMGHHDMEDVNEGMRIAEATLWLKWEYRGRLNCEDQSAYFLTIDAPFFRKCMARSSLNEMVTMYARLFLQLMMETYEHEDEASDLFGNDTLQLEGLVKTVKGVQDGAAKFTTMGLQRGPDLAECFDAWKEEWQHSKKKKGKTTFFAWFLSLFEEKRQPKARSRRFSGTERSEPSMDDSEVLRRRNSDEL